ncbi:MAG: DUF5606 domain-containing protein [Cyclobacteriaceae bacterium]
MEFSDLASVSGKGGLWKVLKPTRTGVVLEAMDGSNKKMVANMHSKVSILSEISIYTNSAEGTVPLEEVMKKIHGEFDGDTGLSGSSSPDEMKSFLKFIIPDYDEDRVYVSDIKKIINWYGMLVKVAPEVFEEKEEVPEQEEEKPQSDA